jgi:hypothetical protein
LMILAAKMQGWLTSSIFLELIVTISVIYDRFS